MGLDALPVGPYLFHPSMCDAKEAMVSQKTHSITEHLEVLTLEKRV